MRWRQSLVGALDPRFTLVLIHGVLGCSLSLPWIGSVELNFLQVDAFRELLQWISRGQDGLKQVKLALINRIGELNVQFHVEIARFMVSVRWHTLAMDDFQVT
jgi:hypothetical protein